MQIKRKIQVGAAAVILNGVVALIGLHSSAAVAGSCTTQLSGCTGPAYCQANPTAWCESLQPGCTVTQAYCYTQGFLCGVLYICDYNP